MSPEGIVAQTRERYRNRLDGAAFANQTKSEQVESNRAPADPAAFSRVACRRSLAQTPMAKNG